MKQMVEDHEKAVQLFTKASKDLKDGEFKEFASRTLPHLKEHREMAKKIHGKVGGQ